MFEDEDVSNVNGNPLLDHQRPKINVVENSLELQIEKDVGALCMPMGLVHEVFFKACMLNRERKKKEETKDYEGSYCQYHEEFVGHSI